MAQLPQAVVDSLAATVYEACLKAPSDQLFSIAELQNMVPGKPNIEAIQRVLNELLRTRSLSALTQGNQTVFKAAPKDYADKYVNATPEPLHTHVLICSRPFLESRICLVTKRYSTVISRRQHEKVSGQKRSRRRQICTLQL